jgi:hypothetical protein
MSNQKEHKPFIVVAYFYLFKKRKDYINKKE